jgi:hypothetical protein
MDLSLRRGFIKTDNTGFNYGVSGEINAGEEIVIRLPVVTANKRGVNDIGWQIEGDAILYATLSDHPADSGTMWMEIRPDEGINKTAAAVKIVAGAETSKVYLRVILN